ncbi:MAG: type II secretion system GspH family protein [Lentisphaeraceae bacterium]|nr:type II secretion system GspH family protein [Lentisphaeraceae bacterium]
MCSNKNSRKFTLIELIVVIAIIAVLVSILLPGLKLARARTQIALCKTNLKQIGNAISMYTMRNDNITPIFRNGTCDAPHEGDRKSSGRIAPGNPALWTYEYLGVTDVYSCSLVETDQKFAIDPKSQNSGLWGTYSYLNYKAPKSSDPYQKYRNGIDAQASIITKVNEKTEDVLMVDFPDESKEVWFPAYNWKYTFVHFNTLWRDNSVKSGGRNIHELNEFLWNKTQWYD